VKTLKPKKLIMERGVTSFLIFPVTIPLTHEKVSTSYIIIFEVFGHESGW